VVSRFEGYGLQPVRKASNIIGALAPEGTFRRTDSRQANSEPDLSFCVTVELTHSDTLMVQTPGVSAAVGAPDPERTPEPIETRP
jgi:hypothetical protein